MKRLVWATEDDANADSLTRSPIVVQLDDESVNQTFEPEVV
jgi:hypothetical protein